MKNKLLQYFLTSSLVIKSQTLLEEYITFCLENQTVFKTHHTAKHHILPKADSCFPEYTSLKQNPWNCAILNHQHHYQAHYLLVRAVKNISINAAWWGMRNKDSKLRGITIEEQSKIYHNLKSEMHELIIKDNAIIEANGKTKKQNQIIASRKTVAKNKSRDGIKNPSANIIDVYDDLNKLVETFEGSFLPRKNLENRPFLPYGALQKSYLHHEKTGDIFRIYIDVTKSTLGGAMGNLKSKNLWQFRGWYAIKRKPIRG